MLIYAMSVSADGYITDREGGIHWTEPDEELFAFHLDRVRTLGGHLCGRRLYETMRVWETDPTLRDSGLHTEFADVWSALPKVVFSRTLDRVSGHARLARGPLADEVARARANVGAQENLEIGGAHLAGAAITAGLVDELRMFRHPVILGGGTPLLPPVTRPVALELLETRTFASRVIYERYRIRTS